MSEQSRVPCLIGQRDDIKAFLFRTGVGPNKATEVCQEALMGEDWDLVVSSGFAGALTPSRIGSILIANEVVMYTTDQTPRQLGSPILCHQGFGAKAFHIAQTLDDVPRVGRVATVSRIFGLAVEIRRLAQQTGAIGLDMESAAIGRIARDRNIPFLVVRMISDLVDEDLPVDFNLFLRPSGWIRGFVRVITKPRSWGDFNRLWTQTARASHQITRFFEKFLDDVGHMEFRQTRKFLTS